MPIKLFFILRRKPEMTKEEFSDYWENTHAPLVRKLPGILRYLQHHVTNIPRPEYAQTEAPVDGIVETWWPSMETLGAVQQSPEFAAVLADEPNFIVHSDRHIQTLLVSKTVSVIDRVDNGC